MRLGKLSTVCEEARCPNRTECFERKTATFLIAGDVCTRACGFCHIASGKPAPLDPLEPASLAAAARDMGLAHVVVTSVDRDDLPDGGSAHWAAVVRALKADDAARTVEVLTPDFQGVAEQIDRVADAGPDVYNHNVETVPAALRHRAAEVGFPALRRPPRPRQGAASRDDGEVGPHARPRREGRRGRSTSSARSGAPASTSSRWGSTCARARGTCPVVEYATPERFAALGEAGNGRWAFRPSSRGPSSGRATAPKSFLESEYCRSRVRARQRAVRRRPSHAGPITF